VRGNPVCRRDCPKSRSPLGSARLSVLSPGAVLPEEGAGVRGVPGIVWVLEVPRTIGDEGVKGRGIGVPGVFGETGG
jgi:hypothetical protein